MGELVGRTNDERVEGVARIETGWTRERRCGRRSDFEGRRFVGTERNHRKVGLGIGHEVEDEIWPFHLVHGFSDHAPVVFGEPVLEEGIGDAYGYRGSVLGDEAGGPEPGVEAVAVHLSLDAGEDVVPDAHYAYLSPPRKSQFFRLSG